MKVIGWAPIANVESIVEQYSPKLDATSSVAPSDPVNTLDEITITDFARINLLMPPRDSAKLAQLQQAVFSGRYGPPAVTIAEAMIALAISRGVTI